MCGDCKTRSTHEKKYRVPQTCNLDRIPEYEENSARNFRVQSESECTLVMVNWTLVMVNWTLVMVNWTLVMVNWTLVMLNLQSVGFASWEYSSVAPGKC